jgi:hypothetical protein
LVTFAIIRPSGKVHDLVGCWRFTITQFVIGTIASVHGRIPPVNRDISCPQLLKARNVDVEGSRGHITAASGSKLWRLSSRVESPLASATDSEPSHLSFLRQDMFIKPSKRSTAIEAQLAVAQASSVVKLAIC